MKAPLLILTLLAALVFPATAAANYSLSDSTEGGGTLVLTAGDEPSLAVNYSVACSGACNVQFTSADGVTVINDATAGCNGSGAIVTCNNAVARVRAIGTGSADS